MGRRKTALACGEERFGVVDRQGQHLADVQPAEPVLQHGGVEALALAHLADGGDPGHHAQIGVDDAGAVAVRAGALGVGAEERRLHAVRLREGLADGLQEPRVGGRVATPRSTDGGLVDGDDALARADRAVDERALARAGDTRDHHQYAERDVHVDVPEVVLGGAADLQHARPITYRLLDRRTVVEVPAGERAAPPQPRDRPLVDDLSPAGTRSRPQIDDMVGDLDHLGLVLDHEHRVALVAQLDEQPVHPLHVVRVQPDRRLVEDVRDVGERRSEVADHLGALGLATRQCAGGPVEREVTEADVDEGVEGALEVREQRGDGRLVESAHPLGEVAQLHRTHVRDAHAGDQRRPGARVEPRTVALGARGERHRTLHERPDVRLHRIHVFGQHRLLHARDEPLVGEVDAVDLDLQRLLVEEVVELGLRIVADRLVRVEEARLAEHAHRPAVRRVARNGDGSTGQ